MNKMGNMGKTVIVTAGPTNERIDAVMQITNMSTGSLGSKIADRLLKFPYVDKVYYLSPKLAYKPKHGHSRKLEMVRVTDTQDLLDKLTELLTNPDEHIDAVVHSAAVGDYKGRYAARAEDLAREIVDQGFVLDNQKTQYEAVLKVLTNPKCVQNDSTKISSYEPNLMVMLDLTPKVIGHIKELSPDTTLIGFKLLEGVPEEELIDVAARLREKNRADYIVANDLAKIGDGRHPAIVIGKDGPVIRCKDKDGIADAILGIIVGK